MLATSKGGDGGAGHGGTCSKHYDQPFCSLGQYVTLLIYKQTIFCKRQLLWHGRWYSFVELQLWLYFRCQYLWGWHFQLGRSVFRSRSNAPLFLVCASAICPFLWLLILAIVNGCCQFSFRWFVPPWINCKQKQGTVLLERAWHQLGVGEQMGCCYRKFRKVHPLVFTWSILFFFDKMAGALGLKNKDHRQHKYMQQLASRTQITRGTPR